MNFWIALVIGAATAWAQAPAANPLSQGLAALQTARYDQAIPLLQQAANASPSDPAPHMHLATAYLQQYVPGHDTIQNDQLAIDAERELQTVLSLQSGHLQAMESLATLHYNRAAGKRDPREKSRALDDSASWYSKIISAAPDHKVAHYSLGVIAWMKFYPELMLARTKLGMRPEDPGPLPDPTVRLDLRARMSHVVQEGMQHLQRALEIDPAYDDAMAYLNLLYRERGDLADSPAEYQRDVQMADSLVQHALETKRTKAMSAQNGGGGTGLRSFVVAPPPPPPPPPPPAPGAPNSIRVGGTVQAAKLIDQPRPEYPPLALQARIQGVVRFNATIRNDGTVGNLQLVSGHPLLVPAAQDAALRYRYQPTLLNGAPVEVVTQLDVNFNLQ